MKLHLLGASALLLTLSACADADADASDAQAAVTADTQASDTQATERPTLAQAATQEAEERAARNPQVPTLDSIVDPKLSTEPLNASMDVMFGPGGNILVLYGDTGALLVDDKFADNGDEILARVNARAGVLPVFVLNTHFHGDHSGSNAQMRSAGALVVAQEGARDLMSRDIENQLFGRTVEARPDADHPNVTFRSEMRLDFADQEVHMLHVPNAHTGGDMVVHFPDADVIHMGDNHFNGMFPYVDIDSGGSLAGMIAAQGLGLRLAGADTVVIPGHGPVTDKDGLQASYDNLLVIRDRMQAEIDAGRTLDEVLARDIYADLGMNEGFINNERIARIAYRSLSSPSGRAVSE